MHARTPQAPNEFPPAAIGLLGACVAAVIIGPNGLLLNSFSLFIAPMGEAFGRSRADISFLLSAMGIGIAITSPLKGWLIDRLSLRRLMLISTLVIGLLLALLSLAQSWETMLALFIALGLAAPGNLPYGKIIAVWFQARRGLAFGIFGVGFGIGGALSLILGEWCIARLGWRPTFLVFGALELLLALPLLWVFFRVPVHIRIFGEGLTPLKPVAGLTFRAALASRPYWLIVANLVLTVFAMTGVIAHGVPILEERGLGQGEATFAFSMLWVGMSTAQLVLGHALDRANSALIVVPFGLCALFGALLLFFGEGHFMLTLAVLLLGFGAGGESGTTQYFVTRYCGLRDFGTIYGSIQPFTFAVAVGLGAYVPGLLHDRIGNYTLVAPLVAASLLLATALLVPLGRFLFATTPQ